MPNPHPIAKEMESWWADHAGLHDDPLWVAFVNDFGSLLIDKLVEMSEEHSNDGRFGMSKAGGCTRAAALKYLGYDSELTGSTRATFAIGHILEVLAVATLRACGYEVSDLQAKSTIDPFMASYSDGRMLLDGIRTNVSVKSNGYKMSGKRYGKGGVTWTRHGFAAVAANGCKAENPGHWAQAQSEMHGAGIPQTLIIYVAKDMVKAMEADPMLIANGSLTFYAELIEYDRDWCESQLVPIWQTQWDAVQAGDAGPRRYFTNSGEWITLDTNDDKGNKEKTGTYDPCSYCDLRNACTIEHPMTRSLEGVA